MGRFVLSPEVPGEMGPESVLDSSVHPPVVHHLSLVLMPGASGDDLAETWPCYVVTDRLATAIDGSGLSGGRWEDVEVHLDEQFVALMPDDAAALPTAWRRLVAEADPSADFHITASGDLVVSEAALALLRQYKLDGCDVREAGGQVPL